MGAGLMSGHDGQDGAGVVCPARRWLFHSTPLPDELISGSVGCRVACAAVVALGMDLDHVGSGVLLALGCWILCCLYSYQHYQT